jgi:hypothetical protein
MFRPDSQGADPYGGEGALPSKMYANLCLEVIEIARIYPRVSMRQAAVFHGVYMRLINLYLEDALRRGAGCLDEDAHEPVPGEGAGLPYLLEMPGQSMERRKPNAAFDAFEAGIREEEDERNHELADRVRRCLPPAGEVMKFVVENPGMGTDQLYSEAAGRFGPREEPSGQAASKQAA